MIDLIERSQKKIPSYGLYVTMPDPQIIEMAKISGYDFARLDAEHAGFDQTTLSEMFRTARLLDFPLQIRLGSLENIDVILAMEPAAIMIPDIQSQEDALKLVERTKFAPLGCRGMYAFSDAIRYGGIDRKEYMANANDKIHTIVQIESKKGLENLNDILSVKGVDMVSSGKADLSQALGIPGQTTDPQVVEAERKIVKTAISKGIVPTLFAETPQRIRAFHEMGVYSIIVGFDCSLCLQALKDRLRICRESSAEN